MPRNASGTYTLPLPPVVPDTTIESVWANTSLDDLAQAVTDSLSRTGQGGMTAPLRFVDGIVSTPGFAWQSEPGTGLYRESTAVMSAAVQGVKISQWSTNGFSMAAGKYLTLPDAPVAATDAANKAYVDASGGGGGGTTAFATKAGSLASGGGSAGTSMTFTISALASSPSFVWGSSSGGGLNNGYLTDSLAVGTAKTVTTAAQPLITSVGSLTSLVVTGAATVGGAVNNNGTTSLNAYSQYVGLEVGWKPSPRIDQSSGTVPSTAKGQTILTTGALTIPANVFNGGDRFRVYNDTAAGIILAQGAGLTLRLAGTAQVGSLTVLQRGIAYVWFTNAAEAVVSGNTAP